MLIIFIQEKLYGFPLFFLDNTKHMFSIIHGPQFYPFAVLPVDDLMDLMRALYATDLGYATCAFTLRGDFREERQVSTDDMLKDTLETARVGFSGSWRRPKTGSRSVCRKHRQSEYCFSKFRLQSKHGFQCGIDRIDISTGSY